MFIHEFLPPVEIEATTTENGRFYQTPAGIFPSVTTVLKNKLDDRKLREWQQRVGKAEAEAISFQARTRGSLVHDVCERFLKNEPDVLDGLMPTDLAAFLQIKPILLKNITKIYGIEFPLYSETLKTAGRADALLAWQGYDSIADFKTARKPLDIKDDRVVKYLLQATVYAMMAEELYNREFLYNIIVVIPGDHSPIQVIAKKNVGYRSIVKDLFQ